MWILMDRVWDDLGGDNEKLGNEKLRKWNISKK